MSPLASSPKAVRRFAAAGVAVFLWIHGTPDAMATFQKTTTAGFSASAHLMGTPTLSCGALGILSAALTWTAPADTTQVDVYGTGFLASGYELARGTASGGPYNTLTAVATTSTTVSLSAGDFYFVVRTSKNSWRSTNSNERHVHAVAGLVATCT